MRILLCPDSFKGCLPAKQVCAALTAGVREAKPDAEVLQIPLSDGGEGFAVSAAAVTRGVLHTCTVQDAYFHQKQAHFAVSPDGTTAYIETAQAAGLQGIDKNDLHTKNASTYGVGELIAAAAGMGCTQIVVGLGGSATTDGGMGALKALGVSFFNIDGNRLAPTGANMACVHTIQTSPAFEAYRSLQFTYACDVQNPFYGETGAAFVFAPQKGATPDEVRTLDVGLRQLADAYHAAFGRDIRKKPAMGAAGGLCGGLYAAFGGEVQSGFLILAESCDLAAEIAAADLVITGEGRTDEQTAYGKLPARVCALAKEQGTPCALISGAITADFSPARFGFCDAAALQTGGRTAADSIQNAAIYLCEAAKQICERVLRKA